MVKIGTTASQKKLFFNLRRLKAKMQPFDQTTLSPEIAAAIATELGVSEGEVLDMDGRLGSGDRSLNQPLSGEAENEWIEVLAADAPDPETLAVESDELDWRRKLLHEGLIKLNERERRILNARRLNDDPLTLQDLGEEYGISRERVRQIENRAFEKLQAAVRDATRDAAYGN
jgi:RNA polymerase sigma-32 factor